MTTRLKTKVALLLVALSWGQAAQAEGGQGDPVAGKIKLRSEVCRECHGEDGNSISLFAPNLAGQSADYIVKQVHAFQTGLRDNPTMNMMAPTVDDSALIDIAAFFASNTKMKGEGDGESLAAKTLFNNGDADRGILPCVGCHGVDGKGGSSGGVTFPVIGGQRWTYLRAQLKNWRNGERTNSPDGIMNKIAGPLTDAEIDALAYYIGGL